MNDRDEDWLLVERAQRGEKHAFDLLVTKYQRKLAGLLARFLKNPAEVGDVSQDAFVKAYTGHYRRFGVTAQFTRGCSASASIPPRTISHLLDVERQHPRIMIRVRQSMSLPGNLVRTGLQLSVKHHPKVFGSLPIRSSIESHDPIPIKRIIGLKRMATGMWNGRRSTRLKNRGSICEM